jgi:hypothetical protein
MRHLLLIILICATDVPAYADDWLQFGYDAAHSGSNTVEATIGPGNVGTLAPRYSVQVPGAAFVGAPIYAGSIETSEGLRDVVYATDYYCTLYAMDASNGRVIWSQTPPVHPYTNTMGSPAIDKDAGYIYSYGCEGQAHKYRLGDGVEATSGGWPQLVALTDVDRVVSSFTIGHANSGNFLYVVTASDHDHFSYHGHLTTISLNSGNQAVFNVTCSNLAFHLVPNGTPGVNDCAVIRGGIWARGGATFDAETNRVYFVSGNGTFDANTGGRDWGDSIIALPPSGAGSNGLPVDSYTPTDYAYLDQTDRDLGTTSLSVIPVPSNSIVRHLGAQIAKDFVLRLIDLDNLNGTHEPGVVGGELLAISHNGCCFPAQPVIWVDPADSSSTWLIQGGVAYQITFASAQPNPQVRWTGVGGGIGCSSVIANSVLYNYCQGTLVAADPRTGTTLWSFSTDYSFGTTWSSPIVADGSVYTFDETGALWKFGLPLPDKIFSNGFDGI